LPTSSRQIVLELASDVRACRLSRLVCDPARVPPGASATTRAILSRAPRAPATGDRASIVAGRPNSCLHGARYRHGSEPWSSGFVDRQPGGQEFSSTSSHHTSRAGSLAAVVPGWQVHLLPVHAQRLVASLAHPEQWWRSTTSDGSTARRRLLPARTERHAHRSDDRCLSGLRDPAVLERASRNEGDIAADGHDIRSSVRATLGYLERRARIAALRR